MPDQHDALPIRLLCLPFAGGGASFFRTWRRLDSSTVDFVGIQLPGREDLIRQPHASSVAEAVEAVLPQVEEQLAVPGPVSLFGHSSGAVIAFELARLLDVSAPGRVDRLFVSGSAAPWLSRPDRTTGLPDDEFVAAVQSFAGATHPALSEPRLRSVVLPPLRADVEMHEAYRQAYGTTTDTAVVAIRGAQDALISEADTREWSHATRSNGFDYVELPGEHMYLTDSRTALIELVASYRKSGASAPFVLEPSEVANILLAGRGPEIVATADSIPDAFTRAAAQAPGRVAVIGESTRMTYAELDEMSRAIAGSLVLNGITPGARVGLCLERSPDAIVAMLAVLRAGGCYVPLDPTHPPMRRAFIADDAGLRVVITDEAADRLPSGVATVTLKTLLGQAAPGPLPVVRPDDPAYVIYTSGTTGDPKGVVIPHRNVVALVAATRSGLSLGPSDVWTVFHSFAFDVSVWEIWGCLLTGGRLVMVPYWTARTPEAFARLLRDERVTVLSQTPSAFVNLIPAVLAGEGSLAVRLVVFGGEPLRRTALVPWVRQIPLADCRLVNMYGITETTVHVTWHDVTATDIAANSRSVGHPLPGWTVSIRDQNGQVLPFGVAGEIWVGGAGLAIGYLGRPDLTAERFPVDATTGVRHYRSGDLGILHPDGTLEHLGRIDDQVKVRGYRVELGEIRAALLDDPAVRDAVVAFRDTSDGGVIHAGVVATGHVTPTDLRRRLRIRLPDYMVPAELRIFDALPLTANGKADLAALVATEGTDDPGPTAVAVASPASSPDAAVHQVWAEVFGASNATEDFFDLGGTSLQALRIATALSETRIREVSPRDIYRNPTISDLVRFMTHD